MTRIYFALLAAGIALCFGCSDSKNHSVVVDPGDTEPPTAQLRFPSGDSHTESSSITVRGTAADNDSVAELLVNGVSANSSDSFATWDAAVTLAPGNNVVAVEAVDASGNRSTTTVNVISQRGSIVQPFGSELDEASATQYYVDINTFKIMAIDLSDGEIIEFADLSQFEPNDPGDAPPLDLALDLENSSIYLTVASNDADGASSVGIWRYDTVTASWSAFSDASIDVDAVLQTPADVLLDRANSRLLVVDYSANAVVAVSLSDGSQSILASNTVPGSSPALLAEPTDAAIDSGANRLLVTNRQNDSIVGIDLTSGAKTVVTDSTIGVAPFLAEPLSIAIDAVNNLAIVQDAGHPGLVAVDLATGIRTGISANGQDPIRMQDVRSLAISGNEALALDNRFDHLVGIDLTTGARRVITNNGFPRGSSSLDVYDFAVRLGTMFGHVFNAVVAINDEGRMNAVAGSIDDPTQGLNVDALTVSDDGNTGYVVEPSNTATSAYRIAAFDLRDGSSQIVSDGGLPDDDNPLNFIYDMQLDAVNNRLVALLENEVLAISLADGSRSILSADNTIAFNSPGSLYVDSVNGRVLVVDFGYDSIIAIDPDTGLRSLFATTPALGDSTIESPDFLSIGSDGRLWLYDQADRLMEIDPQSGTRTGRIDVGSRPRDHWEHMAVTDDTVYAVVDSGIIQLDLLSEDSVVLYGSAPLSGGDE